MLKIIINKYVTKLELNFCKKSFPSWSSGGLNSSIVAKKKKICYARLSSDHQREKSQVGILDRFYPGTEIIKYIGSGLNFRKKEFISLLVQVYLGEVKEIIVL
jgi:predicted site-specific integrase-resolvase